MFQTIEEQLMKEYMSFYETETLFFLGLNHWYFSPSLFAYTWRVKIDFQFVNVIYESAQNNTPRPWLVKDRNLACIHHQGYTTRVTNDLQNYKSISKKYFQQISKNTVFEIMKKIRERIALLIQIQIENSIKLDAI